jgi:hypothetical protein
MPVLNNFFKAPKIQVLFGHAPTMLHGSLLRSPTTGFPDGELFDNPPGRDSGIN